MNPIPPGFSEAADNAPIPGRPWWNRDARRRDGIYFSLFVDNSEGVRRARTPAELAAEAALFDAARPLPHPGYRAGQVWLHENGKTTTVLQVTDDGRPWGLIPGYPWGSSVPMVGELRLADCFLLHDPLMPSRAPWGPA